MLPALTRIDRAAADPDVAPPNRDMNTALQHMTRGDYPIALDILNECYAVDPQDNHIRQLLLKAESGYLQQARRRDFAPNKIPVPVADANARQSTLKPTEMFLLSMLDGQSDIKSITWLAPLREVDVVKALQRMIDEKLIELRDPPGELSEPATEDPQDVPSVQWSPL
jgi:hypothetical protein